MPDLGPHASFILAAYAATVIAVGALAGFIVANDRRQRRALAELDARGIKRRSDPGRAVAAKAEPKVERSGKPGTKGKQAPQKRAARRKTAS